jgi:hypothetical protein
MKKFNFIEPEVIVGIGENTILDTNYNPPKVDHLDLEIEDWLGNDLMESYPCFIITESLKEGLAKSSFTGYTSIEEIEVIKAEYFEDNYQLDKEVPKFYWLKVDGVPFKDDFSISNDNSLKLYKLLISDAVLDFLRKDFKIDMSNVNFENKKIDDIFKRFMDSQK